jgi:Zn-dependent peptidase ImmA (M78 family)
LEITTENHARQRLIDQVNKVKTEYGLRSPLRYEGIGDPITTHLGILVQETTLPFNDGDYLAAKPPEIPTPIIRIDPSKGDPERINFTFFHEVSHHLIRSDDLLYSFLSEYSWGESFDTTLDRFCNLGAAEFLVPSQEVRFIIEKQGFRITLVEELDHQYEASKPAIAIQLAQCASHPCFVSVCDFGILQDRRQNQLSLIRTLPSTIPQLYIQYASRSPSVTKYSLARYTKIPQSHFLSNVYFNRMTSRSRAPIPFRSRKIWEVDCEAFYYKGKVYAAFHLEAPPPPKSIQPPLL